MGGGELGGSELMEGGWIGEGLWIGGGGGLVGVVNWWEDGRFAGGGRVESAMNS